MNTTAPTLTAQDYPVPRTDAVAALRKLADLVESTDLPVPQGIHAQFSTGWEDRDAIRQIAEAHGMSVRESDTTIAATLTVGFAGIHPADYVIHAAQTEVPA